MLKKGLLAGFLNLIVGLIFNFGLQTLSPALTAEYQKSGLFRPWSDPLMLIFFAYPFITGIVLAYFWNLIRHQFKGDDYSKAFQFAKLYFIIATVPGMFITYTTFQVSFMMIMSWTVVGFIEVYVAGLVFSKVK